MGRVTQAMIAEELGVSQKAVSKALRGENSVSEGLKTRVRRAAENHGYRVNRLARSLAEGKSGIVGALFPRFSGRFLSGIVDAADSHLTGKGYRILLRRWTRDSDADDADIEALLAYNVDGLLVFPRTTRPWKETIYQRISAEDMPIVSVRGRIDVPGVGMVSVDNHAGSMDATRHLISLGHRRLCYVGPTPNDVDSEWGDRWRGFMDACRLAGLPDNQMSTYLYADSPSKANLGRFLARHPDATAFFCFNDRMALDVLRAMESLGRKAPDDFSIVGFGDDLQDVDLMRTPLTTVSQSAENIGRLAGEELARRFEGKKPKSEIIVRHRLIVRKSTAAPRQRQ